MKKPELKNFHLMKVKMTPQGADVHFTVDTMEDGEVFNETGSETSTREPSRDLTVHLETMRPFVAQVFGYTKVRELIKSLSLPAKSTKELEQTVQSLIDCIKVTGISVSGMDENKGAIITAKLTVASGQVVAINTPRITFGSTTYGFEEVLGKLCSAVEEESYQFVFEGKSAPPAQLNIFAGGEHTGDDNTDSES